MSHMVPLPWPVHNLPPLLHSRLSQKSVCSGAEPLENQMDICWKKLRINLFTEVCYQAGKQNTLLTKNVE